MPHFARCKYIAIVDRSKDELFLTRKIIQLSYPNVRVHCVTDPSLLVAQLKRATAAGIASSLMCVLLEIRMPRMNGFELIYALRNEIDIHQLPHPHAVRLTRA